MLGLEVVGCLVLEASSFCGGIGAACSSTGSAPSGPKGPVASSRLSRVVDWARLTPFRRGVRDLTGAGFAPAADAGDNELSVGFEGVAGSVVGCKLSAHPLPSMIQYLSTCSLPLLLP